MFPPRRRLTLNRCALPIGRLRRIRRIDVASVCRSDSRDLHQYGLGTGASKVIPTARFRILPADVAVTRRMLAAQNGPAILVGHSYGGVVITEAGTDPKVAGLVYIAAFAPDKGESVSALIKNPPPGAPVPPILPPQDGYLFLDRTQFRASFAADVSADAAAFMADSQVPWGLEALNGAVSEPAWKTKPSWYLVSTDDKMIPPDAQRLMSKRAGSTVTEVKGSHAVYVSQPKAVADLIAKAAHGVALATR